jgi:hypothetical protein
VKGKEVPHALLIDLLELELRVLSSLVVTLAQGIEFRLILDDLAEKLMKRVAQRVIKCYFLSPPAGN